MEKGPEENTRITKEEIGCVLTAGAAVFGLLCVCAPFQKNTELIDNLVLYGIPGFYGILLTSMMIYGRKE